MNRQGLTTTPSRKSSRMSGKPLSPLLAAKRPGSAAKGCLIALAVAFVLLASIAIIGGLIVSKNWRGWVAGPMQEGMNQLVDDSTMADTEKSEVKVVIDDFITDFKSGDISLEELGLIVEQIENSPLLPAAVAQGSYAEYFAGRDDLTEEDKARALIAMSRVSTGMFESTITNNELMTVLAPIEDTAGGPSSVQIQVGSLSIRVKQPEDCTPEELMAVVANAEAQADAAGVPAEPEPLDVSTELQRIIDQGRGQPSPVEATEPADLILDEADAGSVEAEAQATLDAATGEAGESTEPTNEDDGG